MASVVLPGEYIPAQHVNLKLGPGLLQLSATRVSSSQQPVVATRAGILNHSTNKSKWWVEGNSRRVSRTTPSRHAYQASFKYVPAPQESVIGVVTGRSGEGWRVDIGSAHPASLDGLAFEGATKRNKPNLKVRLAFTVHAYI